MEHNGGDITREKYLLGPSDETGWEYFTAETQRRGETTSMSERWFALGEDVAG